MERSLHRVRGDRARARPRRAAQPDAADPVRGARRLPGGRAPCELTRRRLLQWGVAGRRVGLRRQAARLGAGLGVGRRGRRGRADGQVPRPALPGRRQRRPERRSCPTAAPTTPPTSTARPFIHRGQGATRRRDGTDAASARTPLPGPGGAALAFANVTVSKTGGGDNWAKRFGFPGTGDFGFDTLFGDGTGGPGSNLAVMPAVDAKKYSLSHFDNSRHLVRGEQRPSTSRRAGSAAGSTATARATNPLQAVSIDSALSKSIRTAVNPVCAIPSLPMAGFTLNSGGYGGGERRRSRTARDQHARAASPRARGNAYLEALARHLRARRTRRTTTSRRYGAAAGERALPEHEHALVTPADGRAPARRPTSARGSSRSTGAASTPTPTS